MKNGWQTKTLGEVLQRTKTINPLKSPDAEFSYIDVSSVSNATFQIEKTQTLRGKDAPSRARRLVKSNDVLFATVRPTLQRIAIMPSHLDNQVCSTGYCVLRPKAGIDHRFVFYSLFTEGFINRMESLQKGASYPAVTDGEVREHVISFPPLAEQRRVVAILDEAFEGIATAKANAEKNLQNARAVFESHLNAVFTQRGKGWRMEKLDNLTELARGHNPPKSKFSLEQKPGYVRFYQIRDGTTDNYAVYVPDTPQLHKMKKEDIMMVAYRHVGRAFRGVEGAFNVALCKISNVRRDLLEDDFLFHLIPSQFVRGELLKRSERSLIPSMSIEYLREIKIPLPPIREQRRLVETIKSLKEETQRLESIYQQKLAALEALKKSLLHQAFTGAL